MATIRDKVGHIALSNSLRGASESFSAGDRVIERSPGGNVTYREQILVGEVRGTLPGQLSKWPVFSLIIAIPRKGRRVRTVAIPGWVKQGINAWMTAAGAEDGGCFAPCREPARSKRSIILTLWPSSIFITWRGSGDTQKLSPGSSLNLPAFDETRPISLRPIRITV